ncbi:10560_t:CDS:2, partial [Funneliformis geosporum]
SHVTSEMITSDTTAPITLLSMGRITSEKIPNASSEMISSD